MTKQVIYISLDMEADGPIPGVNSMRSLGAVAYSQYGTYLDFFSGNLEPLPAAVQNQGVMNWWKNFPEAWARTTAMPEDPLKLMQRFALWLYELEQHYKAECVLVAYPAAYDYDFVLYYSRLFLKKDPFRGQVIDMRSMAMGLLGAPYAEAAKAKMPKRWFIDVPPHTHVAYEDALSQGALFINMLRESEKRGIYGWLWRRMRDLRARNLP